MNDSTPVLILHTGSIDHECGIELVRRAQAAGPLSQAITDVNTSSVDDVTGLLVRHLEAATEPVVVVSLGTPTALATALTQLPRLTRRIERIVLLGGAYFAAGDATVAAEAAVHRDPRAYITLLASGAQIEFIPLDASDQVTTALLTTGYHASDRLLEDISGRDLRRYPEGLPLRAVTAILWLLVPEAFDGRAVAVKIETSSRLTHGVTSVDWWQLTDDPHNAFYVAGVDAAAVASELRVLVSA